VLIKTTHYLSQVQGSMEHTFLDNSPGLTEKHHLEQVIDRLMLIQNLFTPCP
jgi:hypothetical protein